MLAEYTEISSKLLESANDISNLGNKRQLPQILTKVSEICDKLQTDTFYIAAFGGFSSGKSTFFNAVLGEKLFPSQSTPTTATINFLTYSDKKRLRVTYKSTSELEAAKATGLPEYQNINSKDSRAGTTADLDIGALANVSKESPDSVYVHSIEIFHDSPLLKPKGLVWIDTPGTDSVVEYHKDVTYSLIERADAILFFIYAPVPFKNSDWIFLDDIRRIRNTISEDKFFFVLNAIDGLEEEGVEEIVKYVRKQLETKACISNPKILPVSAKLALLERMKSLSPAEERELQKLMLGLGLDINKRNLAIEASGFPKLYNELSQFLTKSKAWHLADVSGQRLNGLLQDVSKSIEIEEWSMTKSLAELESAIARLEPEIQLKRRVIEECIEGMRRDIAGLKVDVEPMRDKMVVQMYKDIDDKQRLDRQTIESIIAEQQLLLKRSYEKGLSGIIQVYAQKISDIFADFSSNINANLSINFDLNSGEFSGRLTQLTADRFQRTIQQTHYDYEQDSSYSGAGGGALLGGLLAALIPGGLGFLGGALFGGGLGSMFDRPKVTRIPRTITKTITDYTAMRKEAERIASEHARHIGQIARTKLEEGSRGIAEYFKSQCDEKLDALHRELSRIRSDRNSRMSESEERTRVLMSEKEVIAEIKQRIDGLIAVSRERLDA
ncbi:MAG: dynamin family protein [Turneriella sp.]